MFFLSFFLSFCTKHRAVQCLLTGTSLLRSCNSTKELVLLLFVCVFRFFVVVFFVVFLMKLCYFSHGLSVALSFHLPANLTKQVTNCYELKID